VAGRNRPPFTHHHTNVVDLTYTGGASTSGRVCTTTSIPSIEHFYRVLHSTYRTMAYVV
jgi:hypothetical protein